MLYLLFVASFGFICLQGIVLLVGGVADLAIRKGNVRKSATRYYEGTGGVLRPMSALGAHGRVVATNHNGEFRHIGVGRVAYDNTAEGDFEFLQASGGWKMGSRLFFQSAPERRFCVGMPVMVKREGENYRIYRKVNKSYLGENAIGERQETYMTLSPSPALRERLDQIIEHKKGVYRQTL